MATEDLTTYTEVDPESDLTVTSSKVDIDTMDFDYDAYVRADKGANHFGDFEHLVTSEFTAYSALWTTSCFWALGDGVGDVSYTDMNTVNKGLFARMRWTGSAVEARLKDCTNDNTDVWAGASTATPYYMTIERSGTTLTCKIYSDASRTTLEDTLSITCGTDLYRYIFATMAGGSSTGSREYTGYVEDLDLQEAAAPTGTKASPLTLMGVGI